MIKDYERLTIRKEHSQTGDPFIDHLTFLENQIEDGYLAELPCKIGDTLTYFIKNPAYWIPLYYKVKGFRIGAKGLTIETNNGTLRYDECGPFYKAKDLAMPYIRNNFYYVCTKEQAEAQLHRIGAVIFNEKN